MRTTAFIVFAGIVSWSQAQPKVLHYTETSGFDHNTRTVSFQMFEAVGFDCGFTVDHDSTGAAFDVLIDLLEYDVVIFSNTSGDAILDATQRANFESYIAMGGSYLGIHAATDTYRHSTANGSNTGTWDFYAELVGASVQQGPNHVLGTPVYDMDHVGIHESTQQLPDPWTKDEEYYYWANGYYDSLNNVPVLEVEETVSPTGVEVYDSIRPMSWYKLLSGGGKMFYTALGHQASDYVFDMEFRAHLTDALKWILNLPVDVTETDQVVCSMYVWKGQLYMRSPSAGTLVIRAADGRQVRSVVCMAGLSVISMSDLPPGAYIAIYEGQSQKIILSP